ncbi:putative transcriptional regulator, LysR family [Nocardia nova SH22a]|uniref:Putative transcriptional regulator, LysR family n=1 Tax=Nocardia nova SH22a TaxID=1415166 RepID=W5TN64_9NOCA|nr:LysR family transcriptional regulator [Nocardia nova]AHH18691.1 putative transcriptional regulator, LysR family [Nocardia nova SH22a]
MDLDIGAARAFVHTADLLHFNEAAAELGISQQALSKRISKLETLLGVALFERTTRTVRLTGAGRRFLLPARQAVEAADAAVGALDDEFTPIRVDVLAVPLASTLMVDQLAKAEPGLIFERSARRGSAAAILALLRDEIDIAFGRVHGTPEAGIAHCLVRSEPLIVLVPHDHVLAGHSSIRPAELAPFGVWTQAPTIATEWSGFASAFARHFDCRLEFAHVDDVDADYIVRRCVTSGPAFLTATDVANPRDSRLHSIDLVDPIPAYPWSVIWRSDKSDKRIRVAVRTLRMLSDSRGWCPTDATSRWP